jgi:hypothetical protein
MGSHDYSEECPQGPCTACATRVARRGHRVWRLRQLLPLTYRTTYWTMDDREHFAVWRMWFGKVFDHNEVTVDRTAAA